MSSSKIELPRWSKPLFQPNRYKILSGGRAGGKSYAVADALLIQGAQQPQRILCAREYQSSIKDSVHRLLADRIEALKLGRWYEVQRDTIIGRNGTLFIFKGVRHNIQSIKSMAGLTRVWVEEAQTVSEESWRILLPTIREEGSEVWLTLNPNRQADSTSQRFIENPPKGAVVIKVNWSDNPYLPETANEERKRDQELLNPADYAHIWEGAYLVNTDAQVLADKVSVREFEPDATWDGPYIGLDHGYANDPMAAVKCWVHGERLFIEHEAYSTGIELDETADYVCSRIPGAADYVIRADNARPESNSYLKRHGLPRIESVKKWPGSIEDGVAHLRSYREIVIHPRCKNTAHEASMYSYKVDRLSGDVMPDIVDAFNHAMDATRYALVPLMRRRGLSEPIKVEFAI